MPTIDKSNAESENIDLLLLVERSIAFFKKFKWVFIVAIIVGIGIGIMGYIRIPKTYQSRLILHSSYLTNSEYIQMVDNWNNLLHEKEYDELTKAFGVDAKIFPRIKKMKASEIQKVFTPNNPNGFYIDVAVTDNAVLDDLQKGIVNGFESSAYLKLRLAARKADLSELIKTVEGEIAKLDSTKTQVENIVAGKGKGSSPVIIDISTINRQLIDMAEKLLSFRQELKFTSAVQVLQGFSKFSKPSDPKLIPLIALGLILFLGIAYIIALISSVNESLKRRSKQTRNAV